MRCLETHLLTEPSQQARRARSLAQPVGALQDYEFSSDAAACQPALAFDRLRWGGQLVFCADSAGQVEALLALYAGQPEWQIEISTQPFSLPGPSGHPALPPWMRPTFLPRRRPRPRFFAILRKVLLDPVTRLTSRHSYDVRLVQRPTHDATSASDSSWVVRKQVPSLDQAASRLRQTCPGLTDERIEVIARKLVDKVFPVFLTREAAFLKMLRRSMPEPLLPRCVQLLDMQQDDRGLVRAMDLRWMRMGGPPLSQLEFARQTATLLGALHEAVKVWHLDLRLDNIIITDHGVSIIDFGSSIRAGEQTAANAMIDTLLREMLQSSQVTADLQRQRSKGLVHAPIFAALPHPPAPAFDLFALVTQMTRPHDNPDFRGLVRFDRDSAEARFLSELRQITLNPIDIPRRDQIRSVRDLCRRLETGALQPVKPLVAAK